MPTNLAEYGSMASSQPKSLGIVNAYLTVSDVSISKSHGMLHFGIHLAN